MLIIDFETKSDVDLKKHGLERYVRDPSTDILVLGYKIDGDPTQQWLPCNPLPKDLIDYVNSGCLVYAFNLPFDRSIWNGVGSTKYGLPQLFLDQCVDVQALCGRYGLPQNLFDASRALNSKTLKDSTGVGKQLIQMFCCPPHTRPGDNQKLWRDFLRYNIDDIESTYDVVHGLPSSVLSPMENKIWMLNYTINERGIPVDVQMAKRVFEVVNVYLDEHNGRFPKLTGGKVTKVTQCKRIREWVNSRGIALDDLKKETVEQMLMRDDLPDDVIEVLELRAGMGLSSIGKYKRVIDMECDGRMFHNSRYYGAHTGRITGQGFQMLNLPRAKVADPEAEIQKFMTGDIVFENPVLSARALIRPMIHPKDDKVLMVSDYSSIEYIALMWLAEDWTAVKRFDNGFDPYKDLATLMYGVKYEDVTKDQRQMGKIGILGCGYGLGHEGFVLYADQWGVKLSLTEAKRVVDAFRTKYARVPRLWYGLKDAAMAACQTPGLHFTYNKTTFKVVTSRGGHTYLVMTLPSGRNMFYAQPDIREGKYGDAVTVVAMNQLTRKYERKYMTPGKWAENVIQAICRDLLYYGKFALEHEGYTIIASIYDEVVAEVPKGFGSMEEFNYLMCALPTWAAGLPLKAEGYVSTRYKKD